MYVCIYIYIYTHINVHTFNRYHRARRRSVLDQGAAAGHVGLVSVLVLMVLITMMLIVVVVVVVIIIIVVLYSTI